MNSIAFATPIPAGKSDELHKFFEEAAARPHETDDARRSRETLSRDTAWIMSMPPEMGGNVLIAMVEGEDPFKANQGFAESDRPYDVWFKSKLRQILGIDFNQPAPLSQQVWDWKRS